MGYYTKILKKKLLISSLDGPQEPYGRSKTPNIIQIFHLYEMFRRGKFKETEIRLTFNCETGFKQSQKNCLG